MSDRTVPLPRRIYSLWMQGAQNAPPLVRWNFDRWQRLNPSYDLIILDETSCQTYLADLNIDLTGVSVQAQSDIIRLGILEADGGIWVDASVVPLMPLEDWIDDAIAHSDFFAFERSGLVLPLSSWFLAAKPGARIVRDWNALVRSYWSVPRAQLHEVGKPIYVPEDPISVMEPFTPEAAKPYPYFWLHHLFGALLQKDPDFADCWAQRTHMSSKAAHRYADHVHAQTKRRKLLKKLAFEFLRGLGLRPDLALKVVAQGTPLQKLDWRVSYPEVAFEGFEARPKAE
ncbi:capsular polysaccharide synthesis protein [Tateyamaria sp.]|uniref:capsular polysaccharide synthesis protein n=1 Tax=Tateyamaria sp. TaxID=1929288 RepID=UPI0032A0B12B